jgi:hypothetical protein
MQLDEYEHVSLQEIQEWEAKKHEGFHKKVLDVASKPVDFVVGKIGPDRLKAVEGALEKLVRSLLYASTYTVDPAELIKRAHAHGVMIKDLSELKTCALKQLDECNRKHIRFHEKASAVQGALAGLGGALLATADLTAVVTQDFHMIQEIAFCYGYDPNDIVEKQIILRIIEMALGSSQIKFETLREIERLKEIQKQAREKAEKQQGVAVLGAKALEEYVEKLATALVVRLVPRAVPVVSAAVSAHSNHEIMEHSGKAAFMVYRKRFIERKREL